MNLRHLPNLLTGLRLALAPVLPLLLWLGQPMAALWLALGAGLTDALDGLLAKRFGWQSRLGSLLDPVADKTLLGCAFLGLWLAGALPTWLVALVVARDLVILGGAMVWWRVAGPYDGEPSWLGKLTTVAQIALVLVCLFDRAGWAVPLNRLMDITLGVAFLTFVSGVDYVVRYGVKAWQHRGNPAA